MLVPAAIELTKFTCAPLDMDIYTLPSLRPALVIKELLNCKVNGLVYCAESEQHVENIKIAK